MPNPDIDPELLKRAQVEAEQVKEQKKKLYMIAISHGVRGIESFDVFPLDEATLKTFYGKKEQQPKVITIEEAEKLKDDPRCQNKEVTEALLYALKELEG